MTAMESSILQIKMLNNFQSMKKIQQETEVELLQLEENLENYFYQNAPEHTTFMQFVPDTLLFGETQGSNYYRVMVENKHESGADYSITTTYGVRRENDLSFIAKHAKSRSLQDAVQFYHIGKDVVQKQFEWVPAIPAKLSTPLYVSPPQYPFERDNTVQAKSYMQFKLKHANRSSMIYVMSNDGCLWELNHLGKIIHCIDLKKEKQLLLEQWQSVTLTSMDAFWANRWNTILVGVMPSQPMMLFALDITTSKQSDDLLWHTLLPQGAVVQQPKIVRFANDRWGIIFTYLIDHRAHVAFADIQDGHIFKEIVLPILNNAEKVELSTIAPVDSKGGGFCDEVYIGDAYGRLWKIGLDATTNDWHISQYIDLHLGKIIGQPLIGRHPDGKGKRIYLLIQTSDRRHKIAALAIDEQGVLSISFMLDEHCVMHQPLLRQGYLLVHLDDPNGVSKIIVYDAFTGKKERESTLIFLNDSLSLNSSPFSYVPLVFITKPREKENLVLVNGTRGLAIAKMEIDYKRLGRRTWITSLH